jgi:hypothetical protein
MASTREPRLVDRLVLALERGIYDSFDDVLRSWHTRLTESDRAELEVAARRVCGGVPEWGMVGG